MSLDNIISLLELPLSLPERHPSMFLILLLISTLTTLSLMRLTSVLHRPPPPPTANPPPSHVLIVLGSGGHTAELLNLLASEPRFIGRFTRRTYLVSSGDGFSATKAIEFERNLSSSLRTQASGAYQARNEAQTKLEDSFCIVTARRARRVHQPLHSTPLSALACLLDCIRILWGSHPDIPPQIRRQPHMYPDLIVTNGPGTGVVTILASIILNFFGMHGPSVSHSVSAASTGSTGASTSRTVSHPTGRMRTIYIESWARVKTLSLSGKFLLLLVDRFIVQWPQLKERYPTVEYIGNLMN